MLKVVEEYPDVKFEHATGYKTNGTNMANYGLRLYLQDMYKALLLV